MYHRILIATDGSELASKAVDHGISLAKAHDAPVVVVTVTEAWSSLDLARAARDGGAAAQQAKLPVVAVELLGVGIAPAIMAARLAMRR